MEKWPGEGGRGKTVLFPKSLDLGNQWALCKIKCVFKYQDLRLRRYG